MKYFVDYLPITTGNNLKIYVDGKDYFDDLYIELANAKKFVFLTGLHFMANFRLIREGNPTGDAFSLARVLAEIAGRGVEIFLLVNQFWRDESEVIQKRGGLQKRIMKEGKLHGYLPETLKLFRLLNGFKNIHCATDIHPHSDIFGTNHQKTVVVDDKVAFLGGIDLTYLCGDRWDTRDHTVKNRDIDRTEKFWHDIHLRVEGSSVQFVRDNFVQRWKYGHLHTLELYPSKSDVHFGTLIPAKPYNDKIPGLERPRLPSFPISSKKYQYPTGDWIANPEASTVQIVRSMPIKKNWHREKPAWNIDSRDWERSCKDAYLIGIGAARNYIYLENQWVADEHIWKELALAAKRNSKNPDFRIIVLIPYNPLIAAGLGANQEMNISDEIKEVIKVSSNEETFGVYSLVKNIGPSGPTAQIYVHSKILIIDDEWALIGSANAGGVSLEGVRIDPHRTLDKQIGDQPDTELSAIILDKKKVTDFRKTLWEEHLARKVSSTYKAQDADQFRRLAAEQSHKNNVCFFPVYDKVKPRQKNVSISLLKSMSRIIPSFPDWWRHSIPVALFPASFRAHVIPGPPRGYRCWFRWACDLFHDRDISTTGSDRGEALKMRSIRNDQVLELRKYYDYDAAYIGKKTADYINSKVIDVARGRILCRVQLVPLSVDVGPNQANQDFPNFLIGYDCEFMNSEFAKHNLEPGRLPSKK